MFRSSRRKIVAAIMSVLVLLWVGTLGVIYAFSYGEMRRQNGQMLQMQAELFSLSQPITTLPADRPIPGFDHGRPGFDPDSPKFRLSTFFSVAVSYEGEILAVRNAMPTVYSDQTLSKLAQRVIREGKNFGTEKNLSFYLADKDGYHLVVFMDNTVVNESAMTLFRYTLIFGGVALVVFFFLSVFLARKIVAPLEQSYQKQKQFISDAGHELKTPVSVVSANAELLARQLGENQWLANIQYETERMGLLVSQLLELARTENVKVQPERIDLSRLVAGEALPFETVAFEKGLILQSQISQDLFVLGSSHQLKQLVSILLDNALSHSKPEGQVEIFLTAQRNTLTLSVVNPGDEIPPQQQKQLFERFYRADPARSGEENHYGLGLAIAKAIVEAHHGQIRVLCREGLVEFRVELPAVRQS